MKIRVMTINDYDKVYSLWKKTEGMGLNEINDSRDGVAKFLARNPETFKINDLIVIGGNGSLTGAYELSKRHGINVMGIPGTIDRDLAYTDHTIGFDTALNTVLDAITRIRDTSSAHERTTVIEVMGRHCGDIALYAGLTGGAEYVLVPEVEGDINELCQKIIEGTLAGKLHSIIMRAEGYPMSSTELVKEIEKRTDKEVKLVVLSYLQRGGSPTFKDRMFATECAVKAIELIKEGVKNRAIGESCGEVKDFDIGEALNVKRDFRYDIFRGVDILSR